MCGIAGVMYADGRPVDPALLKAMGDRIAHRGPDAEGFWTAPGVGFVHRRLSIIDLSGGAQPLGNEDGTVQVVFNGEIYNYLALRAWLLGRGHHFHTKSPATPWSSGCAACSSLLCGTRAANGCCWRAIISASSCCMSIATPRRCC